MKFLYGLYGANIPVIEEFDIPESNKFEAGELVTISTDGIVSKGAVGPAVGVAAEDHSGEKDILNERSRGTKLRVDITGGGVYSVPAIRLTAAKTGTATTFICSADNVSTNLTNAKLILVEKGENSSNTDCVGKVRKITGVTVSSGTATFTLESAGISDTGDVYALIPAVGFDGNVANDGKSFTCAVGKGVVLTVIGYDEKTLTLKVLLKSKFYE